MLNQKNPGYGDFGNLGKQYDEARQGFPTEVIEYFWTLIQNHNSSILDAGCGTGISTRQLLKPEAHLFGSDKDPEMIKLAKERGPSEIAYFVALASHMPFNEEQFDAITAFSAFHWFNDKKSVDEIRRILKNGGIFFVVNKNDAGDFKKRYKEILSPFIQGALPDAKKNYNPAQILQENGFTNVKEKKFETSEFFDFSQAIAYLQSISIWNLVPGNKKSEALQAIESYCKNRLVGGFIERKLEILVISGRK